MGHDHACICGERCNGSELAHARGCFALTESGGGSESCDGGPLKHTIPRGRSLVGPALDELARLDQLDRLDRIVERLDRLTAVVDRRMHVLEARLDELVDLAGRGLA